MTAALSGSKEIALHDRLDDAVAGRGLHPGAVHGRHRRPAAARVRGDDRRRDSDVRLRLADADADAVGAVPAAAARRCATAGCTWRSSACSMAPRDVYGWTLRQAMTHHGVTMARLGAAARRDGLLLPHHPDGLHPEPGHRPAQRPDRDGAGHRLRVDGRAPAGGHPDRSRRSERQVGDLDDRRRRAAAAARPAAACQIELKPRAERDADGRPGDRRSCGRSSRPCRACACSCTNPPVINIGGRQARAQYQFTLQSGDTDDALRRRRRSSKRSCATMPGHRRRLERPAADQPAGERRARSRPHRGARADRRSGRRRDVQRVRLAAGRADLRAEQRLPGDHARRAGVPARRVGADDCSTSARPTDSRCRCRASPASTPASDRCR